MYVLPLAREYKDLDNAIDIIIVHLNENDSQSDAGIINQRTFGFRACFPKTENNSLLLVIKVNFAASRGTGK